MILSSNRHGQLTALCGVHDSNLRQIETQLGVEVRNRGSEFQISGEDADVAKAESVLQQLNILAEAGEVTQEDVHLAIRSDNYSKVSDSSAVKIKTRNRSIVGSGDNQRGYLTSVKKHSVSFGIGPAGTGKTYLAVACAVDALNKGDVERLVLVRPAVEAGEKLGFLPGDMTQKVDPYLRPLYDALYEMFGVEKVDRLIDRNVIEVAPLAFMRGRTLNNAFIILDEAQNTTVEQMKMFLTRLGYGSTAVVTGDVTQIDLPTSTTSGLKHATTILQDVKGIGFTFFQAKDVVRHQLVQRIVEAYDKN